MDIIPKVVIKKCKIGDNKCSFSLICNTEYKYIYPDQPEAINSSRMGTYHSFQLSKRDNNWIITKEWYTDPFADSLSLENIKADEIKQYISSQPPRDISNINEKEKEQRNMQKGTVERQLLRNMALSIIINIEILIQKVEIVQILRHKYYAKEENSRKILHGTMTKEVQQVLG